LNKTNATKPQPHQTALKRFSTLKNVVNSLEPGKTPSNSASRQAPNYVQQS